MTTIMRLLAERDQACADYAALREGIANVADRIVARARQPIDDPAYSGGAIVRDLRALLAAHPGRDTAPDSERQGGEREALAATLRQELQNAAEESAQRPDWQKRKMPAIADSLARANRDEAQAAPALQLAHILDPEAFQLHPIEQRSRAAALQWAARRKIAYDHAGRALAAGFRPAAADAPATEGGEG